MSAAFEAAEEVAAGRGGGTAAFQATEEAAAGRGGGSRVVAP